MADNQTTTSYTLPPQYIQDFLAGNQQGVAGLFPLLNQSLQNQFQTMGDPGATPYTYGGERIAGFSPRELEAFKLSDQAIGSYMPYLNRQQDLYESGLQRGITGLDQAAALSRQGLDRSLAGIDEAGSRLRGLENLQNQGFGRAEQLFGSGTDEIMRGADRASGLANLGTQRSLAGLGDATSTARGAYGLLGSQLGGSNLTARGTLQDAARTSLGATREFDPRSASRFMNPFENQVVQQTLRDIREQGSMADQRRRAGEIASGAFGGSRSRLQASELADAQRQAELDAVGRIRMAGFGNAQQQAQNAFEQQQRRQAGAASQLGNIAGGLGSLAGQQATAGQNLANQFANYGQAGGLALQNLGATQAGLGSMRGQALGNLGSNVANLTGQRVGLGQNIASGVAGLGQSAGQAYGNLGSTLGNLGLQQANLMRSTGQGIGQLGNNLGALQRQDIGLLGSVGGANRNMNQAINDLAYQNFVGQYNLPTQLLGQYSGIAQGIAPLGGAQGTQTTGTPGIDYTSSALGGFMGALGNTFMGGG